MRVMDERWRAVNRTELMFLIYLEAPRPEGSRRKTGVGSMGRGSDDLGIIHLKSSRSEGYSIELTVVRTGLPLLFSFLSLLTYKEKDTMQKEFNMKNPLVSFSSSVSNISWT
jgi:hypothetical protein